MLDSVADTRPVNRENCLPGARLASPETVGDSVSERDTDPERPKSIRHKKILDAAAEHPDASLEELAEAIPSATADLVDRVLEEYGDPSDEAAVEPPDAGPPAAPADHDPTEADDAEGDAADGPPHSTPPEYPSPERLSEKERRTLRAIHENPTGTQADVAEALGVSAPTVSNRVNGIEGFEWQRRRAFVDAVFEDAESAATTESDSTTDPNANPDSDSARGRSAPDGGAVADVGPSGTATEGGAEPHLESLRRRLAALERAVDARSGATPRAGNARFDDPELLQKTIHACMDSDAISDAEERRILEVLVAPAVGTDPAD